MDEVHETTAGDSDILRDVPHSLAMLWRQRGQEFLELHHEALEEEMERLHRIVDLTPDPVIDLRESVVEETGVGDGRRPVTEADRCHRHVQTPAAARCHDCRQPFCADCVVIIPIGQRPLCQECALVAAGIRHHRRPR